MMNLFIILLVPFFVGLIANLVYDTLRNLRDYEKGDARKLIGSYKLYWYNTKHIRSNMDKEISRASISISRDPLLRLRVTFSQDRLSEEHYEAYEYRGYMRTFETQIHWSMQGANHSETYYAVFDRPLGKQIRCLPGLFLLTENDKFRKPMAIRCVLCEETVQLDEIQDNLGAKDYLAVKRH
jgi:hypothetical protein